LRKKIKSCIECQKPIFFNKIIKNKIKCDKIIDVIINKEKDKKDDLLLLITRKDSTLEKKLFSNIKN